MTKLSLLIPTIFGREKYFESLMGVLSPQCMSERVEFCIVKDNKENSIGQKRNGLLGMATGEWVCFIDDDDWVSPNYISLLMEGINKNVDCCSLKGIITVDGKDPQFFEHSIRYSRYETVEGADFGKGEVKYLRFPNHISCIRASIAKQFSFPDKNFSEDTDWATQIHKSGLLKTEHYIDEVLYHYEYITNKK